MSYSAESIATAWANAEIAAAAAAGAPAPAAAAVAPAAAQADLASSSAADSADADDDFGWTDDALDDLEAEVDSLIPPPQTSAPGGGFAFGAGMGFDFGFGSAAPGAATVPSVAEPRGLAQVQPAAPAATPFAFTFGEAGPGMAGMPAVKSRGLTQVRPSVSAAPSFTFGGGMGSNFGFAAGMAGSSVVSPQGLTQVQPAAAAAPSLAPGGGMSSSSGSAFGMAGSSVVKPQGLTQVQPAAAAATSPVSGGGVLSRFSPPMLRKKEVRFGVPGTSDASPSSAFGSRSSGQKSPQRQVASSLQPQAASSASTAAPVFAAPAAAPVPSVASPVAQQTSGGSQDAATNGQSGTPLGSGPENVSSTSSSCVAPATTAKVAKRHSRATKRVVRREKEALARASVQVLRLKEHLKEQRVASEEARGWRDVAGGLREALERQEREHAEGMRKLEEQHAKSIAEELARVEEKHAKSIAVEVKRAEEMGKKHAKSIAEESRRAEALGEEVQMLKGQLEAAMAGNAGKLQEGLMAKAFRRAQDAVASKSKTVLEQAERIASYERQLKDAIGALDAAGISNGVISPSDYIRESAAAMIDQDKVIVLLDAERKALRAGLEESEGRVKSLEYGKRALQGTLDIADGEKTEALAHTKVLEAKLEKAETRAAFSLPGSFPSECFCGGQQDQVADEEVTPSDGETSDSVIFHIPWAFVFLCIWLTFVSWVLFKPSGVDGSRLASTTVAGVSASCSVLVAATTSFVTSRYWALTPIDIVTGKAGLSIAESFVFAHVFGLSAAKSFNFALPD
ncbi:hypothetical protein MBM_03107 [Drepanopeziza brunnea f. sp. 'multigermtubi' MB_m1]|uniref:Uncharacterized protein n=1 Tax=Marssonina brunnea f. sp. multigermtubi (strain MB_m1) TaxID=1072389 RepID=K1WMD1_MARBU|nr:uncharacterized protein MBM_03107 [Drepanopeziza brunnea f. sp. 'multigermtubi' MB_m1]EKD18865.1 hypothetical protein MBM_03107 [Drepanopeziza brunnea f. sp. 'multigermtubi' MB_m1]